MKITMLGTGTGLIRPERRSPAVLIETKTDSVLIDCGWGVPDAMNNLQFPLHSLGHLCVTHSHADHIATLPALLQSHLIANIGHLPGTPRKRPLIVHGYPGISRDLTLLRDMMIPELDLDRDIQIVEHKGTKSYEYTDLAITTAGVCHVPQLASVAFRIESQGKKIVVTGDLGWDESILPLLRDADIAVIDASASQDEFENDSSRSHLAPIQCGELAKRANVKHLVLTSLYDRESIDTITTAVRRHYAGKLTISHDLQAFDLN